jgi:hypothetical protein
MKDLLALPFSLAALIFSLVSYVQKRGERDQALRKQMTDTLKELTERGQGPRWTSLATGPDFRQLFISGRRAQRARTPNFGFYRIDGPSPQDKPVQPRYRGADIKKQWEGGDVEVVAMFAWADIRMPIVKVNEDAHIATLTLDPRPSNKEVDARYFIENAPDALDAPGEWYLDRKTHTVTYWPVAGENMAAEQVIAPALVQLVRLEGKPETGQFVRNVTFRGLQFAHADWSMDQKGYADTQAAVPAPAAIEGTGAVECKLERCTVAIPAATRSTSGAAANAVRCRRANYSISAAVASNWASPGNRLTIICRTMRT